LSNRPSDTFSVGGKTVTMTYGVLNDITRVGIDIAELGDLILRPEIRNAVISLVLTPRDANGDFDTEDKDFAPVESFKLSVDDAIDLVQWVVEHIAYFFMRSIEQAAQLRDRYAARASSLTSSSDGFESSASKMPSAGLSTAPLPNSGD
jgi:hypothetical protein